MIAGFCCDCEPLVYRVPEDLLEVTHYSLLIDIWSIRCISGLEVIHYSLPIDLWFIRCIVGKLF